MQREVVAACRRLGDAEGWGERRARPDVVEKRRGEARRLGCRSLRDSQSEGSSVPRGAVGPRREREERDGPACCTGEREKVVE